MTEQPVDVRSKARRWLERIAAFVVLFTLAFFVTEIWFRRIKTYVVRQDLADLRAMVRFPTVSMIVEQTPRGKRLIPGARVVVKNNPLSKRDIGIDVDSQGFRNEELAVPRKPGELRILALGDSITMGDYLAADEVWVEVAQRELAHRLPERSVDVINAGLGDFGLREEVDLLEDRGLQALPDAVLVGFYLNDSRPPWGFPGELGAPGWFRRHSVLVDSSYRAFLLRDWIQERGEDRFGWGTAQAGLPWQQDSNAFFELARLARYDWGAAWEEDSWVAIERELERLERVTTEHRLPVAMVVFPVAFQVQATFIEDAPQRRIIDIAGRHGIPVLDLLPLLRAHRDEDQYFDFCHPKVDANRRIGEAVADFLDREVVPRLTDAR